MYLSSNRSADAVGRPEAPAPAGHAGRSGGAIGGTVVALGVVSLLTDVSAEMVTAVLPLYFVTALGLAYLQIGLLDGLYSGVTVFLRLLGGHVADRFGRHKAVAGAGYGLSAACKLGFPLAGASMAGLATVIAADRMGKGLRTAPRDALISLSAPPESQGRAFGVHRAMDAAGAFAGPVLAFVMLSLVGTAFDAIFVVSFCIAVIGLVVLVVYVRDHPGPLTRGQPLSLRSGLGQLGGRRFRRLCLVAGLLGLAAVSDTFLYLVLQHRLHLPAGLFPLLALGTTGVYLLLALPLGHLADRIGRRPVFLAGHLCLLGAYLLLVGPAGLLPAVAAVALHGAFYAATDGVLMAYAGPILPAQVRASGLAVIQTVQATARFTSSVVFGAAWSVWGPQHALAGFSIALAVALAASSVLLPVGQPRLMAAREAAVSATADPGSSRARAALAGALIVALLVVAVAYTWYAVRRDRHGDRTGFAAGSGLALVGPTPQLLFRSTAVGPAFGDLATVPAADPGGPRSVGPSQCQRVYAAARTVLCLGVERGAIARYYAEVLDADLKVRSRTSLEGAPSRARLSADGRMAAWTVFVFGDSYTTVAFSTRTSILDTVTGQLVDSLETFTAYRDGKVYRQPDVNYWGVTFAADGNTFYATLASQRRTWLVRGDLARREVTMLRENVECPSLSPDGTRLVFKKKVSDDVRSPWRLHVLDLATMRETPLSESRSVDDQATWLDDRTVAYALPQESGGSSDIWAVPADGTGAAHLLIRDGASPVFVPGYPVSAPAAGA